MTRPSANFSRAFAKAGITKENTLFIVTADENDHFVGGSPSPANCDGVTTPCTYAKKGEINADLSLVFATEFDDTTAFTVHSDDAPTFYINGNPGQTALATRTLERDAGALLGFDIVTAISRMTLPKLGSALSARACLGWAGSGRFSLTIPISGRRC